jgi:hypothetical protein
VVKPGRRETSRKTRRRWVDKFKMDLRELGWDGMDSIDLAQDRDQWRAHVKMVLSPRVPYNIGKFLSSCTTGGFSRRTHLARVSF